MFCTPRYLFLNISWEAGGWNLGFTNQSCRSNLHFSGDPPTFIAITCINMSSTSYQSSFHGDFIGISCRRDTQPSRPGAVTRRPSFKPRALMRRSRNCYRISSCSWAKSGLKHDHWSILYYHVLSSLLSLLLMNNNNDNHLLPLYITFFLAILFSSLSLLSLSLLTLSLLSLYHCCCNCYCYCCYHCHTSLIACYFCSLIVLNIIFNY